MSATGDEFVTQEQKAHSPKLEQQVVRECRALFLKRHGVEWDESWVRKIAGDIERKHKDDSKAARILTELRRLRRKAETVVAEVDKDPRLASRVPDFRSVVKLQVFVMAFDEHLKQLRPMKAGAPRQFRTQLALRFLQALVEGIDILPEPLVATYRRERRLPTASDLAVISVLCSRESRVQFPDGEHVGDVLAREAGTMKKRMSEAKKEFQRWGGEPAMRPGQESGP